jgi:Rrf2 family protein
MIDLAENMDEDHIPMKNVAERQEISLKYLERIMPVLSKNKLVEGVHGKGGGYRLSREPADYTVGEILRLTEGNLAPVVCLQDGADTCRRAKECRTLPMWDKLNHMVNEYLDSVTIADLMDCDKVDTSVNLDI